MLDWGELLLSWRTPPQQPNSVDCSRNTFQKHLFTQTLYISLTLFHFHHPFPIFPSAQSQFFGGGFGGGGAGGGGRRPQGPRRGKDMAHNLKVSLEDLYKGKVSKLALQKQVICVKCEGKGGKDGAVKSCTG